MPVQTLDSLGNSGALGGETCSEDSDCMNNHCARLAVGDGDIILYNIRIHTIASRLVGRRSRKVVGSYKYIIVFGSGRPFSSFCGEGPAVLMFFWLDVTTRWHRRAKLVTTTRVLVHRKHAGRADEKLDGTTCTRSCPGFSRGVRTRNTVLTAFLPLQSLRGGLLIHPNCVKVAPPRRQQRQNHDDDGGDGGDSTNCGFSRFGVERFCFSRRTATDPATTIKTEPTDPSVVRQHRRRRGRRFAVSSSVADDVDYECNAPLPSRHTQRLELDTQSSTP